jgi:hypothetical protein
VCGGTDFAVRLQAIATPLVQDMGAVGIIPSQKDVDERVLTWKGASVLGRMEGVNDMWVTGADWVSGEAGSSLPAHVPPSHLEHFRDAGGERTMFLIVSAKIRKETVLCELPC